MDELNIDLLRSSYHEAGHAVQCFLTPGAELEFARAASAGRGTSRLVNAVDLEPISAASIAVAGRVSEKVFLGIEEEIPANDGYLLDHARRSGALTDSDVDRVKARCADTLRLSATSVTAIATYLREHADSDCSRAKLLGASGRNDWPVARD